MGKLTSGIFRQSTLARLVVALGVCVATAYTADAAPKKKEKNDANLESIVTEMRTNWPADPVLAVARVRKAMQDHPDYACEIARASFLAAPRRNGKPDPRLIGLLLNGTLRSMYSMNMPVGLKRGGFSKDDGFSKDSVHSGCDPRELILAAVDSLSVDGKRPDATAVEVVLAQALTVIFAYEPSLIDGIIKTIVTQVPDAGPLLAQLRADLLLSPLALTRNRLRIEASAEEPNFRDFSDKDFDQLQSLVPSLQLAEQAQASP